MIVGRQRVALIVVQAVAVGGHAGHEDVARQAVAAGAHGGLHLRGRGAALPVVDIVVDHVEAAAVQGLLDGLGIVAVRHQVLDAARQSMRRLAVHDRHIMAGVAQLLDQLPADEQGTADD